MSTKIQCGLGMKFVCYYSNYLLQMKEIGSITNSCVTWSVNLLNSINTIFFVQFTRISKIFLKISVECSPQFTLSKLIRFHSYYQLCLKFTNLDNFAFFSIFQPIPKKFRLWSQMLYLMRIYDGNCLFVKAPCHTQ